MRRLLAGCALCAIAACGAEPPTSREPPTTPPLVPPTDDDTVDPPVHPPLPPATALRPDCGEPIFPEVRGVRDIAAWGDGLAIAATTGVWLVDESGTRRVDHHVTYRVRADGDGVVYATGTPSIRRVDAAGAVEELLVPPARVVDVLIRGDEVWTTQQEQGLVAATSLSTGARRELVQADDATRMLVTDDAVYVAMPVRGIAQLDLDGGASWLYDASDSAGFFYAVAEMSASEDWVYFTTYIEGGIGRVHRQTGAFEALHISHDHFVADVEAAGEHIYWIENDVGSGGASRVMRAALDGSSPELFLAEACTPAAALLGRLGDDLVVMLDEQTLRVPLAR